MNKSLKTFIGFLGAVLLTAIGALVRLRAHEIVWGNVDSWSGPATETPFALEEMGVAQVGIVLMAGGILLLAITYIHWLFVNPPHR